MQLFENITDFIGESDYFLKDYNSQDIKDFKLYRDNKYKIILEIIFNFSYNKRNIEPIRGRVFSSDELPTFTLIKNDSSQLMELKGAKLIKQGRKVYEDYIESYQISSIIMNNTPIQLISNVKIDYLVEYIDNLDDYSWADKRIKNNTIFTYILKERQTLSIRHLKLKINNIDVYLLSLENKKKGCLIYPKNISLKTREKIRNCISISLGRPIIYFGCAKFTDNFNTLLCFQLKNITKLDYLKYDISTMPLCIINENSLDKNISFIANHIFSNYKKYNFKHILWLYWEARQSVSINASMIYASAIESIQNNYQKMQQNKIEKKLLDNEVWKKIEKDIEKSIDNEMVSNKLLKDNLKIIKNKVQHLNTLPQSIFIEKLFKKLDLNYGDEEKEAYKFRNNIVHGSTLDKIDNKNILKNMKTLQIILHKIILKLTGASHKFIDYRQEGYPEYCLSNKTQKRNKWVLR